MSFSHPKRVATSLTCTRQSPVRLSHSRAGLHRTHRRLLPSLRPGLRAWAATGRHPTRASRHRLRTPDRRGLFTVGDGEVTILRLFSGGRNWEETMRRRVAHVPIDAAPGAKREMSTMSHGAIARPNLSNSAVVLAANDLEGSVGLKRESRSSDRSLSTVPEPEYQGSKPSHSEAHYASYDTATAVRPSGPTRVERRSMYWTRIGWRKYKDYALLPHGRPTLSAKGYEKKCIRLARGSCTY